MSIDEIIRQRCGEGVLFPVEPLVPSDPCRRGLFASAEIMGIMNGPEGQVVPWSQARSIMDTFITGGLIGVSQGKKYRKLAHMGHLDPRIKGVWTMKPSKPAPGIRVFGQFARHDLFIAMDWRDRFFLEDYNSFAWKNAIRGCQAQWRRLFPSYQPLTDDDSHAYISNIFLV